VTPFEIKKIKIVKQKIYEEIKKLVKKEFKKKKHTNTKITNKKILADKRENKSRGYETNNIWDTRESRYWQWIRAIEWWKRFEAKDEEENILRVKEKLKELGV